MCLENTPEKIPFSQADNNGFQIFLTEYSGNTYNYGVSSGQEVACAVCQTNGLATRAFYISWGTTACPGLDAKM
eukprot:m.30898 g.30898  ORF g.30898 m.30898 type:complete len:74 (+) comp12362_c0_seq1:138-359(+)